MTENAGYRAFTAYTDLAAARRVKLRSGTTTTPPEVVYAGAGEQHIGVVQHAAAAGMLASVRLRTVPGSVEIEAAGAFAVGATLYGAANGTVDDVSAGSAIGQAVEAAGSAGAIVECMEFGVLSTTAGTVSIADAGAFTSQATVEAALQELYQQIISIQGFVPIPLVGVRELSTGSFQNAAANGGLLASDTSPALNTVNGDTDGVFRVSWAAGNSDPIAFQTPLPPDLDDTADLVIHFRASMAGATNTCVISADTYFHAGGSKIEDDSGAVTGTTDAEYTITIAGSDVPGGAQQISCELTPAAHATDALYLTGLWLEYKRKLVTA